MRCKKVYLLLPGYISHSPFESADYASFPGEALAEPSAFRFSDQYSREPWQSQFADILGLNTGNGKQLPTARLALISRDSDSASSELASYQGVVRADPVFLKADRDSARLVPAEQLALSEVDADHLLNTLNDFVAVDGLEFFKLSSGEWYMCGMSADLLESYPPSFLASRNVSAFLPDGDSMASWRRLLTELQMLLHDHPLNQQREAMGLMPVNSVWFWGGGSLPAKHSHCPDVTVFADHVQAADMARHLKVPCRSLSSLADVPIEELLATTQAIILDTALVNAWLDAEENQLEHNLERINRQWLAPLIEQVRAGHIEELHILTEDGLQGCCNKQTISEMTPKHHAGWLPSLIRLFKR